MTNTSIRPSPDITPTTPDMMAAIIEWEGNEPEGRMTLLKGNRPVSYTYKDGKVTVKLPRGLKNEPVALKFNLKK